MKILMENTVQQFIMKNSKDTLVTDYNFSPVYLINHHLPS